MYKIVVFDLDGTLVRDSLTQYMQDDFDVQKLSKLPTNDNAVAIYEKYLADPRWEKFIITGRPDTHKCRRITEAWLIDNSSTQPGCLLLMRPSNISASAVSTWKASIVGKLLQSHPRTSDLHVYEDNLETLQLIKLVADPIIKRIKLVSVQDDVLSSWYSK